MCKENFHTYARGQLPPSIPRPTPAIMATPLYKRYIPLSKPAAPSTASVAPPLAPPKQQSPPAQVQKRKRERSETEVAERKAKKLRKKGVETSVEDVLEQQRAERKQATATKPAPKHAAPQSVVLEDVSVHPNADIVDGGTAAEEGEKKMSMRKRHKLEKEARKARKEAEWAAKAEDGQDAAGEAEDGRDVVSATEGADMDAVIDQTPTESVEDASGLKQRKKRRKEIEDEHGGAADEVQPEDAKAPASELKASRKSGQNKRRDQESSQAGLDEDEGVSSKTSAMNGAAADGGITASPNQPISSAPDHEVHDPFGKHTAMLSRFKKATERAQPGGAKAATEPSTTGHEKPEVRLHDLEPLPQPAPADMPDYIPDPDSALPAWLAKPTVVAADTTCDFSTLKLAPPTVDLLENKLGFKAAMPVQQALIPLLLPPGMPGSRFLPGTETVLPDIAVSAATGSGKTVAYLLPIVAALKAAPGLGRLRALIVVPTRELVAQVASVASQLAEGSHVKVGTATGTGKLREEQDRLISKRHVFDPEAHAELMKKQSRRNYPPTELDDDYEDYLDELDSDDVREEQRLRDAIKAPKHHLVVYESAVDLLICTPGRLLEHLGSTLGFSLSHLKWLVLDEADKLLSQQYDGFLDSLHIHISQPRAEEEQGAREKLLRKAGLWREEEERRVRKVVLSATMTKDVGLLAGLRLSRPELVVVRCEEAAVDGEQPRARGEAFELPPTLMEYCVPVGEGNKKPLFLIKLLEKNILEDIPAAAPKTSIAKAVTSNAESGSDTSGWEDDDSSVLSSSSSDISSTAGSDDSNDSDTASVSSAFSNESAAAETSTMHPARAALLAPTKAKIAGPPTVLIFTSSTESAHRLSHLLRGLRPEWSSVITLLTKTSSKAKSGPRGSPNKPCITISTDRASRGLDTLSSSNRPVTHVLQYDVPRSVEGYVHRVGRTARAGRDGEGWTLYTHGEARWFLHEICGVAAKDGPAGQGKIRRPRAVEKVKVEVEDQDLERLFEDVLQSMRGEVFGGADRRGKEVRPS